MLCFVEDVPWWLGGKESGMQESQVQSLGWEDPGGGHDNPLQDSCLENPMDRRAWQTTVHGVAKSWMTERLSTHHFILSNSSVWVLAVAPTLEIHKLRFMEVE